MKFIFQVIGCRLPWKLIVGVLFADIKGFLITACIRTENGYFDQARSAMSRHSVMSHLFKKSKGYWTNQQLLLPDVTGCHGDDLVNAADRSSDAMHVCASAWIFA